MSAARPAPAQKSNDLTAWWRIEAQWQKTKKPTGQTMMVAVHFLDAVLKSERDPLNTFPKLSPKGYARMHHTFSRHIGNSNFRHLSRADREKALVGLSFCASQSMHWRDRDGRPMAQAWGLCMDNCLDLMESTGDLQDTLHDVLNSSLDPLMRLDICKKGAALDWLIPTLAPKLDALLPPEEHARLGLLAWSWNTMTNMRIVQHYCPQLYVMLAGLAPASAWVHQEDMLLFAEPFRVPVNPEPMALALPDAWDAVDTQSHALPP